MTELEDVGDLKSSDRNIVWVQVPLPALKETDMICENCSYNSHGYCCKTNDMIFFVKCESEVEDMAKKTKGQPKLCSYERDRKYKAKMKRLAKLLHHSWYHSPVSYRNRQHEYCDEDDAAYVSRNYHGKRGKYVKLYSNRRVRRHNKEIKSGGSYKRIYDYWWELY